MKVGAQTLASWCHICSVDLESKSSLYVVFFVIWFILLSNSDLAWLLKKLGEQNVSLFWVLHLHIGTVELVWVYIFQVGRGFFLITFAVAASSSIFVFLFVEILHLGLSLILGLIALCPQRYWVKFNPLH